MVLVPGRPEPGRRAVTLDPPTLASMAAIGEDLDTGARSPRVGPGARPSTELSAYPFVARVRPRFAETDAMGVVHHAAHLQYLEVARVEYLRSRGHPYGSVRQEGLDFPVAEVAVHYLLPLRFDEPVDVGTAVVDVRGAAFRVHYVLAVEGAPRAWAVTRHAVVDPAGRPVRAPAWLRGLVAG